MTKLMEETFRAVNIALPNEFADICHRLDIEVMDVIDAASTKPYGFMPFTPGPGVGGHCIPCDPHYLLSDRNHGLAGARVLVLGVAYKPDVEDLRESPALEIIAAMTADGAEVAYHDPWCPTAPDGQGGALTSVRDPTAVRQRQRPSCDSGVDAVCRDSLPDSIRAGWDTARLQPSIRAQTPDERIRDDYSRCGHTDGAPARPRQNPRPPELPPGPGWGS